MVRIERIERVKLAVRGFRIPSVAGTTKVRYSIKPM